MCVADVTDTAYAIRAAEIVRNPDPGFTPGSTPGFGPDPGSNSVAVGRNKMTEPLDFTYLAS